MSDTWQNKIIPILTHPVLALHGIFFVALYIGLIKVITSIIFQRRRELEADFRIFTSELSLVVFVVALLAGAMAVVYRLQGKERPVASEAEGFKDRVQRWLNDPFFLLDLGIYAVAYLGLIATVLLMIEVSGSGPVAVWSWWATQMFFMIAGVLALVAVRALANAVVGQQASTATSSAQRSASSASEAGEGSGDEPSEDSSGPGPVHRLVNSLSTWQQLLGVGVLALAYVGLLMFVLDMWAWRNFPPNFIWENFFYELALIAGAVGFILLLTRLVEAASHSASNDTPDSGSSMVQQVTTRFYNPGLAAMMVMVAVAVTGGAWTLVNIWGARNQDVLEFWATVTWTLFHLVPAVALPLVLWSLWKVVTTPAARNSASLLYNPYKLLTLVIYVSAYLGTIDFVFHTWIYREQGPAWIWDTVGEDLFNVVARVGVFVALRAIVAAVVMGPNPPVVEAAGETSSSDADEADDNSIDVEPDPEGGWNVMRPGGQRASAHTDTQEEAIERAREILGNSGGGELRIHGRDGEVRDTENIERD